MCSCIMYVAKRALPQKRRLFSGDTDMPKINLAITISAPIERVYAVSQDYDVRYDWDPFPEKMEFLQDNKSIAIGDQVKVVARSGLVMTVEFIQLCPPKVAAIKMVKGPWFLKSFAGSWHFTEVEQGVTNAKFNYQIELKPYLNFFLVNELVKHYFSQKVQQRLAGLKSYCEKTNAL